MGSDKMKKYNILLSLNKKKNKLNELVLKKKLSSKVIIHLSQEIDELQNKLEQTEFCSLYFFKIGLKYLSSAALRALIASSILSKYPQK